MQGSGFQAPEFLKIKGYKYRAKMLIAGAAILIFIIILLSMIINGISSALKRSPSAGADKDSDINTDTAFTYSESAGSIDLDTSSDAPPEVGSDTVSSSPAALSDKEEKFNADGKLVIDTDTLDGKKAIAITFDDGPGDYTTELINGLNARHARATFFMVGSCVEQHPDVLPLMVSGGHQLGNHTYSHSNITKTSDSGALDEINLTDEAIFNACGQRSTAFRPPYGAYTPEFAKKLDKTFTLWSLDTMDWKFRDADKVKETITSTCRDGSIILLHDLYKTSVDGALAAIDELQSQGYVFVTVDELMTRYGYAIKPGAHSAQYAVYETNSPHASEYEADMERDRRRDAASAAANAFSFDTDTENAWDNNNNSDTDLSSDSGNNDDSDNGYYDNNDNNYDNNYDDDGGYRVVETQSDSDRLVY